MKKLLTTTALIGLVASSVSSYAETKVTGAIEQTYNANSVGGTDAKKGSDGLGQENNLKITSSKELDNGMSLKGGFQIEDGAVDSSSIILSSYLSSRGLIAKTPDSHPENWGSNPAGGNQVLYFLSQFTIFQEVL